MTIAKHIPNTLTLGNLICGCLGIVSIFENSPTTAAYYVWAACVFDFLDGFSARLLKASSPIGKELDSLADMVSFGVLPSLVMYQWMRAASTIDWLPYFSFLIVAFSALRLAKFNNDPNQTDSFIGMPTPANAIFLTSLGFLPPMFDGLLSNVYILIVITAAFSLLLVSPLPLFALKFKSYRWQGNSLRFTFLLLAVLLFAWIQAAALPFIILLYLFLSLFGGRLAKE